MLCIELEIPNVAASAGNKIRHIFLDPSGRHLIISMFSDDVYYISRNIKQARPLARLRVCCYGVFIYCYTYYK